MSFLYLWVKNRTPLSSWSLTKVEGQYHLPQPAGHTYLDAARVQLALWVVGPHCQLIFIFSNIGVPQALLHRAALNLFITHVALISGIALTQVQDLALSLVELQFFHLSSLNIPCGCHPFPSPLCLAWCRLVYSCSQKCV